MRIKLISIIIIGLIFRCGEGKVKEYHQSKSKHAVKEDILGLWKVNCNRNLVLRDADTVLITLLDQKIDIKLQNDERINFEGFSFNENKMEFHITQDDTTRYYEFFLSNDYKQFKGGTAEGWDGQEQKIELTKFD